jgi:antitoxin MazE
MKARIQKWGNSLALRIPRSIAIDAGFAEQTMVDITLEQGVVMITRTAQTEYTLDELLQNVSSTNIHAESDLGAPEGNEEW